MVERAQPSCAYQVIRDSMHGWPAQIAEEAAPPSNVLADGVSLNVLPSDGQDARSLMAHVRMSALKQVLQASKVT